jgi:chromosome partitioning protein
MIITVGGEKGGIGKSKVATHISVLAACNGIDGALLDTDIQGSAISFSRIRNEGGITPTIPVFALPPNPARELANLASKYTLVVVDIGAQNYRTMLECALLSDIVLVPCGNDQQEVESTLSVFSTLKKMGNRHELGHIPAHVILNRVSPIEGAKSTAELREYLASEDISVFKSQIAHRASWLASGKSGKAVHELKGRDRSQKAIDEMQAVYDEIIKRINGKEVK